MRYLAFVPVVITVYLIVSSVAAKAARCSPEWQKNRVYLPNLLFWVGLLGNLFVIPSVILLWQENLLGLAFVALGLMGWSMQLAYANCWVRFGDRGFTHHTFFGRTHEFTYNDVTGIRWGSDIRLYCGKHLIFLDNMAVNSDRFLKWVRKRSKQMELLPDRIQWDPYNGNFAHGKLTFFAFLIPILFWTGFMIFCLVAVYGPAETEADMERRQTAFTDWREANSGNLYLTAEDGTEYGIEYGLRGLDQETLLPTICDGKTLCTVWGHSSQTFWIGQLQAGDRMIFTFEKHHADYRQRQQWAIPLLVLIWAASIWAFVMSLRIGKDPDRYSPRVQRWFMGN